MQTIKKRVAFEECITIRHYEYQRDEEMEEKLGKDWLRTQDLTCREFMLPVEKGGCGRNWQILQHKLDALGEPCWKMIGILWHSLHPCARRLEEDNDDNDDLGKEEKMATEDDNELGKEEKMATEDDDDEM